MITFPLYAQQTYGSHYVRRTVTVNPREIESYSTAVLATGSYGATSEYTRVRTRSGDEFVVELAHETVHEMVCAALFEPEGRPE